MAKTKKKKEKSIFEGIRKPTVGRGSKFKTRKDELDRKQKHKGKDNENE
jgi:hypothetical protein